MEPSLDGGVLRESTEAGDNVTTHKGKRVILGQGMSIAGPRMMLKGDHSRSKSRGRSKSRNQRPQLGPNGLPARSVSRPSKIGNRKGGQEQSIPQVQQNGALSARSWASVARVMTKGYNLAFVPPSVENGELVVDITPEIAAESDPRWLECIVGHYIGRKVPFKLTEEAIKRAWGDQVTDVKLHENGFYFIRVPNADFRRKQVDSGPITIFRSTMLLQQWHAKLKLKKGTLDTIPVWMRLRDIPFPLWSSAGIGRIASAVGNPLYVDSQTELMTRISFARVCVELKASAPRPDSIKVRWESDIHMINIEYEWKPLACTTCGIFGHKMGSPGFQCASLHPDLRTEKDPRPQVVHRPGSDSRPQAEAGWTVVSRNKSKLPSFDDPNRAHTGAGTTLNEAQGEETSHPLTSVSQPAFSPLLQPRTTASTLSLPSACSPKEHGHQQDSVSPFTDGHSDACRELAGADHPQTQPDLGPLPVPDRDEHSPRKHPSCSAESPIHVSPVLHVQGLSSAFCIQQVSEQQTGAQTSQSSTGESSGNQPEDESEDLLEEEPASNPLPNTRSRTLASGYEGISKLTHGPLPMMEQNSKASGLSSSKKTKRRQTRRAQR